MTIYYNAFHSPLGAHSSFTLGCCGQKGGFGVELGRPANQNVYIGLESPRGGSFEALPFFEGAEDPSLLYDHSRAKKGAATKVLTTFDPAKIQRDYQPGTDCWQAGDLTFTVYSVIESAPEPGKASVADLKEAYCPSLIAELTIDNTGCKRERLAFFGFAAANGSDSFRIMDNLPARYQGIAHGNMTAVVSDTPGVQSGQAFCIEDILTAKIPQNLTFGLGDVGSLTLRVAPGKKVTARFALCFFRPGIVTSGAAASYWYYRYFKSIESVAEYTLINFTDIRKRALRSNELFAGRKLNPAQQFQLIHAVRSYMGSTQLLDWNGKPFWVVNEGEYRMMNTFDLTVDQLFYEMRLNPWTVRNELDMFTTRYSYSDKAHHPGGENIHPGGLSFTHDMGRCNRLSRPGYSTYELYGLTGCFSHMTHEQLVNWVLCAAVYVKGSDDKKWLKKNLPVFRQCLQSLLNRDHPQDAQRNGVMGLDSSRTLQGAEITTYDSLDESLGQARGNVYLAVKSWAAYLALEAIFDRSKLIKDATQAKTQAGRAAATIASYLGKDGCIPAILGESCNAKIIPSIEGLAFPYVLGMPEALKANGEYGSLIKALSIHLKSILQKGVCLYPDGGWKLSSSADNSWLSKIYLCQFVARKILKVRTPATGEIADHAHQQWLLKDGNLYWAWSDQMKSGVAMGSKYYPRGVTAILWLDE